MNESEVKCEQEDETKEMKVVKEPKKQVEESKEKKMEVDVKKDEDISDLEKKIIRQIEYYFGDINLSKDKFLQTEIKLDDGWVPLETMIKFNRLANLTKDFNVILTSIKKSRSGLMEVNEEQDKIRRSPDKPVPEPGANPRQELADRTIYCKGFPKEATLNELLEFFHTYDDVINVVMRNYNDKLTKEWHFKGSVFVNFKTPESGEQFLKKEVSYKGAELKRMWVNDYFELKRKEKQEKMKARQEKKPTQDKTGENGGEEKMIEELTLPSGTVVHITGFHPDKQLKREDIKSTIEGLGFAVAYVDYSMGLEFAWVRLEEMDTAKKLVEKLEEEGGLVVEGCKLVVRLLEEEEEKKFLQKAKEALVKRKLSAKNKWKNGRKRKGKGRKRKGTPDDEDDEPKEKIKK